VKTSVGGTTITALTNAFGYYNLAGVFTGQTYTVSVSSKGHRFTSQGVFVGNQFVTVNFIGQ
jgi:glutamate dehydrogenase/leucine dehydrogenase